MQESLQILLYRAFHGKRNYLRPYLTQLGLGPGQPKLLDYLAAHGPCRQRQLAEYFSIDPAAVSRMLDALEKGGFITRQPDQNCRRAGLIVPTQKGLEAAKQWRVHYTEAEDAMLTGFSAQEQAQFKEYLQRAAQNIAAADKRRSECRE